MKNRRRCKKEMTFNIWVTDLPAMPTSRVKKKLGDHVFRATARGCGIRPLAIRDCHRRQWDYPAFRTFPTHAEFDRMIRIHLFSFFPLYTAQCTYKTYTKCECNLPLLQQNRLPSAICGGLGVKPCAFCRGLSRHDLLSLCCLLFPKQSLSQDRILTN